MSLNNYEFKYHVIRIQGRDKLEDQLNYWADWPSIEVKQILPIAPNYYDIIYIKYGEK